KLPRAARARRDALVGSDRRRRPSCPFGQYRLQEVRRALALRVRRSAALPFGLRRARRHEPRRAPLARRRSGRRARVSTRARRGATRRAAAEAHYEEAFLDLDRFLDPTDTAAAGFQEHAPMSAHDDARAPPADAPLRALEIECTCPIVQAASPTFEVAELA